MATSFVYNMSDTWNNGSTEFDAIKMDVTNTASAAGSLLMDLLVGSVSKFSVSPDGLTSLGSDLLFNESANHGGTPAEGTGLLWVRSDTPNVLVFTDDEGTDTVLGAGLLATDIDTYAELNAIVADVTLSHSSLTETLTNKSGSNLQWTNDAGYVTATLNQEEVEDYAGNMVANATGTHTRITVTYQDATGDMDFVVDPDLSNYNNDSGFLTDITGENLSSLADVTITAIAAGEILKWSGSAWINNTLAEAGITATGHTHVEADITDLQSYLLAADIDTYAELNTIVADVTLSHSSLTETLTNKTIDANGTGNSITNIDLSADVIGNLPVTNLASGTGADATTFWRGDGSWVTPAGAGDVMKTGTPVDNQIAVWTDSSTIEGDADLTFDTTTNTLALAPSAGTSIMSVGGVNVLVDSPRGTMTLSGIDALDATTETTIEAAIDTLPNLTSASSLSITESQISDLQSYSVLPVADTQTLVSGSADATKLLRFEVDGQTTSVTGVIATTFTTAKTLTLPDATDTLVGKATTDTLTNKTIDANGTGNSITNIDLSADVIGNLPKENLNSGTGATASTFWRGDETWATPAGGGDFMADGTVPMTGDIDLDGNNIDDGGVIFLREQAAADADVDAQGQWWVKTATPNVPMFTNDAGTDFQLASLDGTETLTNKSGSNLQWTNDAGYVTATLTQEEVEDYVGGMVTGNTETLITVTYQDADGTLDFVVTNTLSSYSNDANFAVTTTDLSQFATTSSATLRALLSDETGTGFAYFQGGDIGTPSAGVATNLTGTAAGLTAGTVTTNANLTGHVTSVGNATSLGSFTLAQLDTAMSTGGVADGTTFLRGDNTWAVPAGAGDMVLASAQTVTGAKTFDAGTLLLNDTDSLFDLELGSTSTITTANKTLTFDVNDANRTLTISADATVNGTNTGDQTTIVGITGTLAEFNTALTDTDFVSTSTNQNITGQKTFTADNLRLFNSNGALDLIINATGSFGGGHKTLSIDVNDADRTLDLTGDATISGTNTGDQTITLTGDVTGSGTGSFAATITADSVTYDKMQDTSGTDVLLGRSTAGAGTVEEITCTPFARTILDDADGPAVRATIGAGTGSGDGDFLANGTVPMTGDIDLDGNNLDDGGVIFLREQAAADADVDAQGQWWVKTATPNVPMFTNDAGTDFQLASLDGTETLTNKTINTASNTITIVEADISDLQSYLLSTDIDTYSELNTIVADVTLSHSSLTETLTNKTFDANGTGNSISNVDLTADIIGTLPLGNGGTGQTTAQTAIDALTAVSGATNEHVLTKDTGTGNATFKAVSKQITIYAVDFDTDLTSGDGKAYFRIPSELAAYSLTGVGIQVGAAQSTTNEPTVMIHRLRIATEGGARGTTDMLSTAAKIQINEWDSKDHGTQPVVGTGDVNEGDLIRIDVDEAGTGTQGLFVTLEFG